ncbi:MAG: hypothetical protein NE327_04135 [Lentisphaeraceae bacterium]|nr:hypothetical protein [Lentisphaeraceae bacterium]
MTSCEKCRICKERNIVEHGEPGEDGEKITGFKCYVCKGINNFNINNPIRQIVIGYDPAEA